MWVWGENSERIRSWGTFLGSHHFGGRRACWNSGMGLGRMTSNQSLTRTCTNQTTSWLMHSLSTFDARTGHVSQPHFGLSVRVKPTLPKVGTWSPPGLLKTQSSSWRAKTPRIGVFLVSLERSWSLDIKNGLALVIWTSVAQVMGKRRAGSQTGSLTPDH